MYGHAGHIGHVALRVCTIFLFIWLHLAQWGIEGVGV